MTLSSEELSEISTRTVGHYDDRASAFWEGTRDHDVTQNIEALLRGLDNRCMEALSYFRTTSYWRRSTCQELHM